MNIKYILSLACFSLLLCSCHDDESHSAVYIADGRKQINKTFVITKDPYSLPFTVSLVGADYPTQNFSSDNDIEVFLKVDPAGVDFINTANKTDYEILPEGSYELPASVMITNGTATATVDLKLTADGKITPAVNYILPITIDHVQGGTASNIQQTVYFILNGTLEPFDKSNWEVVSFSSQEANGEGPNNGKAIFAIDNNKDSFWHTQWQGTEPQPPHNIVIDMKEQKNVHGIILRPRDFWRAQPTKISIEVSENNVDWKDGGTFDQVPTSFDDHIIYTNEPITGQYLRFTILETNQGTWSSAVAEIGAL